MFAAVRANSARHLYPRFGTFYTAAVKLSRLVLLYILCGDCRYKLILAYKILTTTQPSYLHNLMVLIRLWTFCGFLFTICALAPDGRTDIDVRHGRVRLFMSPIKPRSYTSFPASWSCFKLALEGCFIIDSLYLRHHAWQPIGLIL